MLNSKQMQSFKILRLEAFCDFLCCETSPQNHIHTASRLTAKSFIWCVRFVVQVSESGLAYATADLRHIQESYVPPPHAYLQHRHLVSPAPSPAICRLEGFLVS